MRARRFVFAAGLILAGLPTPGGGQVSASWPIYGQNLSNTRVQDAETGITKGSVARLRQKWFFKTRRDVTGTPIVAGGAVYAADTGGTLWAIDATTGAERWHRTLGGPVFSTAAYADGRVYVGDNGGTLWAFDAGTGDLIWSVKPETEADIAPYAQFWSSPVPFEGKIYVGLAGEDKEITFTVDRKVWRGSVVALDATDGHTVWKTPVQPKVCAPGEPNGDRCSGGSVWSTAAIDPARRLAFWGTGNAYDDPAGGMTDAMIAVNIDTGKIEWAHQFTAGDSWSHSPEQIVGDPDWDFGSSAVLFEVERGGQTIPVVGEGQKSGDFRVVDRSTGASVWSAHLAGGNAGAWAGGFIGSPALAYGRIYAGATDPVADTPFPTVSNHLAFSTRDGALRWQVPDVLWVWSPPAVANGVVFQGSSTGVMLALDADTGAQLWSSPSVGGIIASGPAIVDGSVYFGAGCCGGESESSGVYAFGL